VCKRSPLFHNSLFLPINMVVLIETGTQPCAFVNAFTIPISIVRRRPFMQWHPALG
jgi:hypothetical protein